MEFYEEGMKKSILILSFLFIFNSVILPQIVIENPEKPLSKNGGRVIQLEEVMRIKDDGYEIIFKNPKDLSLSEDGSILLTDFIDGSRLYKFSKDGQFIFRALKQGQGPRECRLTSNYFIQGNRIRVQAWLPPKVIDYNSDGKYLKEMKTDYIGPFWFLEFIDGKIYGIKDEIRFSDAIRKEGFIETPYTLYEISEDFKELKKLYDFPVRHYIKQGHWYRRDMVDAAVYENFLFMVHTAEYKIVKFDLHHAKIERIFNRKYKRQKIHEEEIEEDIYDPESRRFRPPPLEYSFDISRIHLFRGSLWVITSTSKDNNSKWIVDVFDMEGKYIDSFYLQFPLNNETHWIGNSILSDDGFIFIPEQNQDGLVSIGKYRIKEKF